MFRSPIFYAILAFLISLFVIGLIMPDLVCMDGWGSPSIGSSGACSHHGGVNNTPVFIGLIACFAIAFFAWKKAKKHQDKLIDPNNKFILEAEKTSFNVIGFLNRILCNTWNLIIKLIKKIGIPKLFDKAPILTIIAGFIAIAIFPPVMLAVFILGFVAYLNDARPETSYLVPPKK